MNKSHTPYDDVFRTLLNGCSSLMLPMVNEIFQETYTGAEELRFFPNEHFLNQQGGSGEERITDMSIRVLEHIAAKYPRVKEGVKSIMIGKVLDYEAKDILNKGRSEGQMALINKIRKNGYSYEEISKITGIAAESLKEAAEGRAGKGH